METAGYKPAARLGQGNRIRRVWRVQEQLVVMKTFAMRTKKLCFALALVVAALLTPAGFAADDFALGPVIVKGKGFEIRRSQLDDAFVAFRANLAARGQNIQEGLREGTEAQLLNRMIITELLVKKATDADREKARTNSVKFLLDSRKVADTEEDFQRHLKSLGMSMVQFTNRIMEQAISEEVIGRELKTKISIPDTDVKKFYETNDAAFKQPELARASHILIATKDFKTGQQLGETERKAKKARAEKILERAKKGEDFGALALEVSEDPGVKENKGEYKFARAKDDARRAMVPEFEAAAFSLRAGQISDLVTTDYGFHIIKLYELTPARKADYDEVRQRVLDFLTQAALEKQMPAYFEKIKQEAGVEIVDEKLRATLEKIDRERPASPVK